MNHGVIHQMESLWGHRRDVPFYAVGAHRGQVEVFKNCGRIGAPLCNVDAAPHSLFGLDGSDQSVVPDQHRFWDTIRRFIQAT